MNDKCYLTFTIKDSHGRARYLAAYAAHGRRGVNAKIKIILSFTIIMSMMIKNVFEKADTSLKDSR